MGQEAVYSMAITIRQIAQICGVSRGTVDRVVNHRGNVKAETAQKVQKVIDQLGYVPNPAGKALAAKQKKLVIGALLISEGNDFFSDVKKGMNRAQKEMEEYGIQIEIRTMKGYEVKNQIQLIEAMKDHINLLILQPINQPAIIAKINELTKENIPVITINTDVEGSGRMCYIGNDYEKSGRTACGMLGILTGGSANVGIITGSVKVLGHNQRIMGFREVYEKLYPDFRILEMCETNDDNKQGYDVTVRLLKRYPELNALFVVAAGAEGVCKAVEEAGRQDEIRIVAFDSTDGITQLVKKGVINATICQQPFTQGYKSTMVAANYLLSGIHPDKEKYITKSEIKIAENI